MLAALAAVAIAGAAAIGISMKRDEVPAARPQAERPTLALLTSLPLVFGESFGLDSGGSAVLTRLSSVTMSSRSAWPTPPAWKGKVLCGASAGAAAEVLVELDQWCAAAGGCCCWPIPSSIAERAALGDKLRAPLHSLTPDC